MCRRCGEGGRMARALVLLACAAAAGGARYADYAGGRMPQYGGGADYDADTGDERAPPAEDYLGHSPDAPASPDYKYEEERHSNTEKPSNFIDDAEKWRKVKRKQRGLHRPTEQDTHHGLDTLNKYIEDDEEELAARPSRGRDERRSRPRAFTDEEPPSPPRRRSAKYTRDRNNDVSDMRSIDRDEFSDDKSKDFEEEVHFAIRDTTRRVNRRKPRDRNMKMFDDVFNMDDVVEADRRMRPDDEKQSDYSPAEAERRRRPGERGQRQRLRPQLDDDDVANRRPSAHRKNMYEEYTDYYDMKRVQNIKHKLPTLLRRTSTVKAPTKKLQDTVIMHEMWTNRRLGMVPSAPSAPTNSDSDSDTGDIIDIGASIRPLLPSDPTAVPLSRPTKAKPDSVTGLTTTMTTMKMQSTVAPAVIPHELSLAEKSRLSILKKAQRKDGVKEEATMKPPVLLQVTHKLATVVMVEPPSSPRPWMSVRQMSGDSPERIERVKKLMRRKLVAQAKNIQELTDNWDSMVCDYIDVALLENGAPARPCCSVPMTLIILSKIPYGLVTLRFG